MAVVDHVTDQVPSAPGVVSSWSRISTYVGPTSLPRSVIRTGASTQPSPLMTTLPTWGPSVTVIEPTATDPLTVIQVGLAIHSEPVLS